MTRPHVHSHAVRFPVEPRLIPPMKAARRLHLTLSEFSAIQHALQRAGFPAPCSITGHYDIVAIDAWIARRSGAADAPALDDRDKLNKRLADLG